ncbi:hypothetical protein G7Y89_g9124 [Cudoniella acicularis]|uniref:Uncharacterized protein n=1 Tax=Cudoniella acicularis TaxID=354080 RepID=A0A8H4RIZ1_9HELO|nr:hypothetical protein G7Y89_g9124 [Cudoniella acicularis]
MLRRLSSPKTFTSDTPKYVDRNDLINFLNRDCQYACLAKDGALSTGSQSSTIQEFVNFLIAWICNTPYEIIIRNYDASQTNNRLALALTTALSARKYKPLEFYRNGTRPGWCWLGTQFDTNRPDIVQLAIFNNSSHAIGGPNHDQGGMKNISLPGNNLANFLRFDVPYMYSKEEIDSGNIMMTYNYGKHSSDVDGSENV